MEQLALTRRVGTGEGYRRWSSSYDSQPNPMLSLEQRFVQPLLPEISGRDVVDLGCGTGRWLHALASRSPRSLTGVDSSASMLARARKKLGPRAILLAGDCENAALEDLSADVILCSFVLSYISDLDRLAVQVRRIARPHADILVADLHPETEQKLGWQRGFRDGDARVEISTHRRPLAAILSSFQRCGLEPAAFIEPIFGEPEFAILDRAGKSALIEELRNYPAIYVLQFRPESNSQRRGRETLDRGTVTRLCGCRIGIGPGEDARADIAVEHGRIASIDSRLATGLPAADGHAADLSGFLVLPGLINAHDHLEFALFPRLGKGGYRNFQEWADDIHTPDSSPVREHRAVPKETRLWWGAIRNLLCGVTTVCHHNPYVADVFENGFPVRVTRDFGWAHSIPMDSDIAAKHDGTPPEQPFIVHLAEGVDRTSAEEIFELDRIGALNKRTVIVHGLALSDPEALSLLKSRGASLVWCPSSNAFLFGKTHSRKTIEKFPRVALGSDSSLTAGGDLLDELRFARQEVGVTAEKLYSQVTLNASDVLRLHSGEGSIRVGSPADLIAIRDKHLTPAETLASSTYRDVELVILGGCVQLASSRVKERLSAELTIGLERLEIDAEVRWIRAPLGKLFDDATQVLGRDLTMNGRRLSHDHAA